MKYIVILCTTNTKESADVIARTLVTEELAACVNIIPKITSVYKWNDNIENDEEYLLFIKTKENLFDEVKNRIISIHPYDVPEVVSLDITNGSSIYLDWIANNTK